MYVHIVCVFSVLVISFFFSDRYTWTYQNKENETHTAKFNLNIRGLPVIHDHNETTVCLCL
jgi:hypothetical protein